MKAIFVASLCFLFSLKVLAGNLVSPMDFENTGLLPKGIRSPRIKYLNIDIQDKFTASGSVVPIASALNKEVSWKDVGKSKEGVEQELFEASVKSKGFSLSDGPGATTGDVNIRLDVQVPIFAYGITKKWTLALATPIYRVQSRVATGFVANSSGSAWLKSINKSSVLKADEAKTKLENAIQQKLSDKGYLALEDENFSHIGDIKLISKNLLLENKAHRLLLKSEVVFPTGKRPNPDLIVDIPTGDGQTDISMTIIYDYERFFSSIGNRLRFESHMGYIWQSANYRTWRIPEEQGSSIGEEKQKLWTDLGDQFRLGGSLTYGDTKDGSSFGVGYDYQYQQALDIGSKGIREVRFIEGLNAEAQLHSFTMVYGYSTIGAFRKKKFPVPMQLNISMAQPVAGTNLNESKIIHSELTLFF